MLELNTLQINVAQLLKADIGTVRNYTVEEVVDIAGADRLVQGEVRLTRTDRSLLVKGTLHTNVELTCSRCLGLFASTLTLNIEEEYFPRIDIYTGNALPPPEEGDSFTIDEHNIIDLTEAVRQYALLAVPMKPLCRPDCSGLCPACGQNLNQGSCVCPPAPIDPRWDKLRELVSVAKQTSTNERKGMK